MAVDCEAVTLALTQLDLVNVAGPLTSLCGAVLPYWTLILAAAAVAGLAVRYWRAIKGWLPRLGLAFRVLLSGETGSAPNGEVVPPKLAFVVDPHQTWWHMGKKRDAPIMQIAVRGKVTNLGNIGVMLLHASVEGHKTDHGHVSVKDSESAYHGSFMLLPGHITDMSIDLFVDPPPAKEGHEFTATICVVDNFGRTHRIPAVRFRYT